MLLVLRRKGGGTLPRDFIRFLRCQFERLPVRSGFVRVFAEGGGLPFRQQCGSSAEAVRKQCGSSAEAVRKSARQVTPPG